MYRFLALVLLLKTVCLSCFATAIHPPLFENDRDFSVPGLSVSLRVLGTFISENDIKQIQHVSLAVITRKQAVVGLLEFLYYIQNEGSEGVSEWFVLHRVNIAESHRKKGYAGAAVETFLTALAQAKTGSQKKKFKKSQAIYLTIEDQNDPFLGAFYEKFGFRGDEDQLSALVGPKQRFLFSLLRQEDQGKVMMMALGDAKFPYYKELQRAQKTEVSQTKAHSTEPSGTIGLKGSSSSAPKSKEDQARDDARLSQKLHEMLIGLGEMTTTERPGFIFQKGETKRIQGYATGIRVRSAVDLSAGHEYYHLDIINDTNTSVGTIVFSHFIQHQRFGDNMLVLDDLAVQPEFQRGGHAGRALECWFSALKNVQPPLHPDTRVRVTIAGKAFLSGFYGKFGFKKIPQANFDVSKPRHEVVERRAVRLSKVTFPYYQKNRAGSAGATGSSM